jgi:probable HAF family extracellular repeat protein
MFTLPTSSHLRFVRGGLALCWVLLAMTLAAQAQTQAACTFNFFSRKTQFKLQDGTPVFMIPIGINDFGTTVGYAYPGPARGLIRWANGGITSVKGTSRLDARNDHGISVGFDLTNQAVVVNGTSITPIVLDVNNGGISQVRGINKWGTIVGQYIRPSGVGVRGFKRWNTGTTHILDFPGALSNTTRPTGINDNGTVVGTYSNPDFSIHGFIFHNGQWATLDYPHAVATHLDGITNAGRIIGNAFFDLGLQTPFLYENGKFKLISVPKPGSWDVGTISPKQGLILGLTSGPAFIAQCQ